MYDYKEGQKRINNIINNERIEVEKLDYIPKDESQWTFKNGIKAWTCGLFVDIVDSTKLFKEYPNKDVATIIRAFTSEVVSIIKDSPLNRDVGIRGDCVFGIYEAPKKVNIDEVVGIAAKVNTFIKALNIALTNAGLPNISVGIGIGANEVLIAKVGRPRTEGSDLVYFGSAIVNASKLSGIAGRNGFPAILIDNLCFYNLADLKCTLNETYKELGKKSYIDVLDEEVYGYDLVSTEYNNWIIGGMKN